MFSIGYANSYQNQIVSHPHGASPYITHWNISTFIGTATTKFTKLPNAATLPVSGVNYATGAMWNPTGDICAITSQESPYIKFYERTGNTTTLLTAVTSPVASGSIDRGGGWHPNNNLFTSGFGVYPYIYIWRRSATTSTRFESVSTTTLFWNNLVPTGACRGGTWNPQGNIMVLAQGTSPFFRSFWWDGTQFTRLADPASLPAGGGDAPGPVFSPDGSIVVHTHATTPWITAYWVNYNGTATTFTRLATPASLPGNTTSMCAFNNTGSSIVVSHYNTPYVSCYNIAYNGTLTTLTRTAALPALVGNAYSGTFLPDDNSFIYGQYASRYFYWLTRSGDTFTIQPTIPDTNQTGNTNGPGTLWPTRTTK